MHEGARTGAQRGIEQGLGAGDVRPDEGGGALDGAVHMRLRREVHHLVVPSDEVVHEGASRMSPWTKRNAGWSLTGSRFAGFPA